MTKPMSWLPDPLKGGQDQVGVPQVPLFGHGDALETGNFAYTALMTLARACGLSPCGIYLLPMMLTLTLFQELRSDLLRGLLWEVCSDGQLQEAPEGVRTLPRRAPTTGTDKDLFEL